MGLFMLSHETKCITLTNVSREIFHFQHFCHTDHIISYFFIPKYSPIPFNKTPAVVIISPWLAGEPPTDWGFLVVNVVFLSQGHPSVDSPSFLNDIFVGNHRICKVPSLGIYVIPYP